MSLVCWTLLPLLPNFPSPTAPPQNRTVFHLRIFHDNNHELRRKRKSSRRIKRIQTNLDSESKGSKRNDSRCSPSTKKIEVWASERWWGKRDKWCTYSKWKTVLECCRHPMSYQRDCGKLRKGLQTFRISAIDTDIDTSTINTEKGNTKRNMFDQETSRPKKLNERWKRWTELEVNHSVLRQMGWIDVCRVPVDVCRVTQKRQFSHGVSRSLTLPDT